MTSISFDRAVGFYDATRGYPPGVGEQIAVALIDAAHVPADGTFLEIGIGTGRIALPIIQQGYHYTGIDISTAMVEELQRKLAEYSAAHPEQTIVPPELIIGDSRAMPFADGTFDAAIAVHVLHLISDWERALDEMLRVLKPGGWLLIGGDTSVPNADRPDIIGTWTKMLDALGYADPVRDRRSHPGADQQQVQAALVARGFTPILSRPVTWQSELVPSREVQYIAARYGSRTWDIPDEVFLPSVERLEAALRAELGERYDQPIAITAQFGIMAAQRPPAD